MGRGGVRGAPLSAPVAVCSCALPVAVCSVLRLRRGLCRRGSRPAPERAVRRTRRSVVGIATRRGSGVIDGVRGVRVAVVVLAPSGALVGATLGRCICASEGVGAVATVADAAASCRPIGQLRDEEEGAYGAHDEAAHPVEERALAALRHATIAVRAAALEHAKVAAREVVEATEHGVGGTGRRAPVERWRVPAARSVQRSRTSPPPPPPPPREDRQSVRACEQQSLSGSKRSVD